MAGEVGTALAGVEVADAHPQDQLIAAAANRAVHAAVFEPDKGPEDLPDVENHPWIQEDHTMGEMHDYYPLHFRII